MKKLFLASTALFALSGVTAATAQVDISGNVRFHYQAWSDGISDTQGSNNNSTNATTQINFSADTVSESGLRIQPYARLTHEKVTKRYIQLTDDWGTLVLGGQTTPAYSFSLGADWRGTVAGASAPGGIARDLAKDGSALSTEDAQRIGSGSGIALSGSTDAKVIYLAPTVNALKIGVSLTDAGGSSKADITEFGVQYTLPERWGVGATLGYASASRSDSGTTQNAATTGKAQFANQDGASNTEIGVALSYGPWQASLVQVDRSWDFTRAASGSGNAAKPASAVEISESGQELEVVYSASDKLTVNAVLYSGEGDKKAGSPVSEDTYSSTGLGAKYTIAPGLYASLGWNSFEYEAKANKADHSFKGSAYTIRLHADF